MSKWLRLLFLIAVLILFQSLNDGSSLVFAQTIELPQELYGEREHDIERGMVKQLSSEDITLQGLTDSIEMYYEVPVAGVKKGSYLKLNIQYSRLLLNDSTITVLIDDVPVDSVKLDVRKSNMQLKVPLEGHAVSQGFHRITIVFYGHISEHECTNEENPANWLTIAKDSHLYLNVDETHQPNLALNNYPYPFIQIFQEEPVQSTIVIPDNASLSIVKAALTLANYLSEQAGGSREIPILLESDLKTISTHIIALGKNTDWSAMIKELYVSANINLSEKELVVSNYFLKFPQVTKQVLFVTATSDQTIEEKIAVLTDSRYVSQLAGAEVSIDKLTREKSKTKQNYTFQELNIPSLTLTGKNEMSPYYFVQLPAYADMQKPATLRLNLKLSDTLFTHNELTKEKAAELVVYVNNEPHSIAIDDLKTDDETSSYHVSLLIEAEVLQKSPLVSLLFQANGLKDREVCKPPNEDRWIYISEDSRIEWSTVKEDLEANSRLWPAPFSNSETAILLPREYNKQLFSQLQMMTNRLGNARALENIQLLYGDDADRKKLKNRHVIVFGNPYDYSGLKNDSEHLLIPLDSNRLDLSAFRFVNETAEHVVWFQPSLWDEKRSMAVFSAVHPKKTTTFLSEEIVEYLRLTGLPATVVVESQNGDIFTNAQVVSEETSQATFDEQTSTIENGWFIAGIIGMAVVIVILLLYVIRKTKKDKKD